MKTFIIYWRNIIKLHKKHLLIFFRLLFIFILPFFVSLYLFNPFTKIDLGTGAEYFSLSDTQITGADKHPFKLLVADMLQIPLDIRFYEIHVKLGIIPNEVLQTFTTSTAVIQIRNANQKTNLDCNSDELKERSEGSLGFSGGQNYETIPGKDFCFLYNTNQGISLGGIFAYEGGYINSRNKSFPDYETTFEVYAKQNLFLFFIKYIILFFILNGIWLLILSIIKNLVLFRK